jgi:anti-sigma B factor antagonist
LPDLLTPWECAVHPDRDQVTVALAGELDVATVPDVERAVDDLIRVGFPKVIVDLSRLTFIDSTGLRALVGAARTARGWGCELSLVPGPESVQRAFVLTGLDSSFTFECKRRRLRLV